MILFNGVFTSDEEANEIMMKHTQKRLQRQIEMVYLSYDQNNTGRVYENNLIYRARVSDYFPECVQEKDRDGFFDEIYRALKSENYVELSKGPNGIIYDYVINQLVEREIRWYRRYNLPNKYRLTAEETDKCLKAIKEDIREEGSCFETAQQRLERYLSMEDFVDNFFWDFDFMHLRLLSKEDIQNSFLNKVAGIV